MTGLPIRNRLTMFLVAAIFVVSGAFALSFLSMDGAYAAKYATNYDYDATANAEELSAMPGVYRVTVNMNTEAEPKTIGIPTVAKQNLENQATKEMPGIIMGAAVNYEVRTGAIDFTPIEGAELLPPYSYFRYNYGQKQEKNPDGTTRTIKTLTGFDGSYYIVRVDVSNIIADAEAKAAANGETLDGKFLHVRQENNKALLVATGMTDYSYVWADTAKENNKGGCKAAAYPLANNAEAMKDTSGEDNKTTYLDVILMSSAKNVAGADAGSETAPVSNVDLSFYVDDTKDYKPWMKALDPNKMPTFPYTIKDDKGNDVKFETEADYNQGLTTKFFDETKATLEKNSLTKYRVMGEDLEIDVAVDVNGDSATDEGESRGDWMGENMDFWSMEKAIANQAYDNHTIIMICEVPVLNGLSISGPETGEKKRSVVLDVNSFDIQIANNTTEGKAGLTIDSNAVLRIKDGSNTAGAELAIGNNATMVIKKGGTMVIDETCTAEAEFDAASTVDPATDPAHYLSGEITIQEGGNLTNWGVINIEGTEGKPLDPSQQDQIIRDKQSADILVEYGGVLDNYGCISLKGTLHNLGMLNNYGKYNDILRAYDPDKNLIDYHRGIQITWKDDVTQEGVEPGVLYVGIDTEGNIEKRAELNNHGDIVLCPGTIDLAGTYNSVHPSGDPDFTGHLYLCTVDEAIIPIVNPTDPTVVEKRVTIDPPKESVFNRREGCTVIGDERLIGNATVELVHNGVLGNLYPTEETADNEIKIAEEALTAAETAVRTAQQAWDDLVKEYADNIPTDKAVEAKNAVVNAQLAVSKAAAKVETAKQTKQLSAMYSKLQNLNKQIAEVSVVDISNYAATLEKTSYAYTGKEIKPAVKVAGLTAADYTASYANNKEVGTATVTITPKDSTKYKGAIKATFAITKVSQAINKVTPASKKIKAKKGKVKKNTKFTLKAKATGDPAAKVTFTKANKAGKKKIAITKAGKVTVKKGLKKGTYKVKVKVTKAETAHYKAATKTFTIKVIVK